MTKHVWRAGDIFSCSSVGTGIGVTLGGNEEFFWLRDHYGCTDLKYNTRKNSKPISDCDVIYVGNIEDYGVSVKDMQRWQNANSKK